jgi:hypothetical protein
MRKTWFFLAALGLGLTGRAWAAPSFFGPTGLLAIPTADTLAEQSWNVHVHATDPLTTFGGSYGITKALEVGVSGVTPKHGDTKALFHAKYALLQESGKAPGLAVGGADLSSEFGDDPAVYLVASKSLSSLLGSQMAKYNLRGHIGYNFTRNSIFARRVLGGVDLQLQQNVQVMVEWLAGNLFFGGRVGFGKGIRAELGSYDGDFGGGISYAAAMK